MKALPGWWEEKRKKQTSDAISYDSIQLLGSFFFLLIGNSVADVGSSGSRKTTYFRYVM